MTEVQKADPEARRRALRMMVLGVAIGVPVIYFFEGYSPLLADWIGRDPARSAVRLRLALAVTTVAISGPALGLSAYFWRLGARVIEAGCFPPPGFGVVRDTPIVRGPAALRRGRFLHAAAAALALAAMAVPMLFHQIPSLLGS